MSCKVSFIGLGVMGYPMAGFISKGGHDVTVYNRTKAKADKWVSEYKGNVANTPAEAAKDSDFIFTCVGNDNDLREVKMDCLIQLKKILFTLITLQPQPR
jgi:3-hydroxyisobutyrate dehydrogenase